MRISDWSSDVCSSDLRSEAIIQEANLQLEQKVKERTGEIIRKNLEIEDERKKQMASEYERKLAMAEMSTLRAQMNPHFMFNSLNTLEAFILRSEEHTSELQSLMRISYAVFCLKKKNKITNVSKNLHSTTIS